MKKLIAKKSCNSTKRGNHIAFWRRQWIKKQELCVQLQGEESFYYEFYIATLDDFMSAEYKKMTAKEQNAIDIEDIQEIILKNP